MATCAALLITAPALASSEIPSTAADATLVATGKVGGLSGKTAASVPIVLFAWPSNDVVKTMQVGDEVTLQPLAETTSARDGSFDLRLSSIDALAPVTGSDRIVNFSIVAGDGENIVYDFARRVMPSSAGKMLTDATSETDSGADAAARPPLLSIDLVGKQITDANAGGDLQDVDPGAVDVPNDGSTDPGPNPTGFQKACTTQLVANYGVRWALVGQHYNSTQYVATDYEYTVGASSEIGVGTSAKGTKGTFKASGTMAVSSSDTINFDRVGYNQSRYRRSQFQYGKYRVSCTRPGGIPVPYYQARTTAWAGGASNQIPASTPKATNCTSYAANTSHTKASSVAVTWNNGVDIDAVIGIDLSIRTGYSRSAKTVYTFYAKRWLCGTGGYPGATPSQLVART